MDTFSKRNGYVVEEGLKIDRLTREDRNRIWNFWKGLPFQPDSYTVVVDSLGREVDSSQIRNIETIRHSILEESNPWYEVYDILEYTFDAYVAERSGDTGESFEEKLNGLLAEINSGYRMLNGRFVKVFNQAQEDSIENAQRIKLGNAGYGIRKALNLYSDRQNPDYHNAIKEAISAVEELCKNYTKRKSSTLGDAIKALRTERTDIDEKILNALEDLYAFSNKMKGVRHNTAQVGVDLQSEARMYISICSTIMEYLQEKMDVSTRQS